MAETVAPSVRGRQRLLVELALLAGAVSTAALIGFGFGIATQGVATIAGSALSPSMPDSDIGRFVIAIVAVGVLLDLAHLVTGRLQPITLGRQVPREWGRLLPPAVAAVLYGGRLGVGPLTILSTWMWWAMLLGASLMGVWSAVGVSIWFATARIAVNGIVGRQLDRGRPSNLALTGSRRRRNWSGLTGLAVVMTVAAALVTGCGLAEPAVRPILTENAGAAPVHNIITSEAVPTPATAPARLEDVVRTSVSLDQVALDEATLDGFAATGRSPSASSSPSTSTSPSSSASLASPPDAPPADPLGLHALAPGALNGMMPIDDPSVDRFLTIDQASAIQPDPTEEIALLETRGYRGGWIRAFRSPTSDVAVASVYEFENATEAEFYLEDGLITIGGYGGAFFDIAELPEVRGFSQDVADDGETVRTLGGAFHRNNRWFLLYVVGSPETVTPDVLLRALHSWHDDLS